MELNLSLTYLKGILKMLTENADLEKFFFTQADKGFLSKIKNKPGVKWSFGETLILISYCACTV